MPFVIFLYLVDMISNLSLSLFASHEFSNAIVYCIMLTGLDLKQLSLWVIFSLVFCFTID